MGMLKYDKLIKESKKELEELLKKKSLIKNYQQKQ